MKLLIICIETYYDTYQKKFPVTTESRKSHIDKLWITPAIKKSSAQKNKLYKIWLLSNQEQDLNKYKIYKRIFTNIVRSAKINYYCNVFDKVAGNSKKNMEGDQQAW